MRVMRLALRLVGILVIAALLLIGGVYLASESGEVIVLRTYDAGGAPHETQVRGTDDDETMWIRAGRVGNAWYWRFLANGNVETARAGKMAPMLAARDASIA